MRDETPRGWMAFHIFYHADQDILLLRCIHPLVRRLRIDGLIGEYFFVRYWNGGPHVRLRLKVACNRSLVQSIVEDAVEGFLRQDPGGTGLSEDDYAANARYRVADSSASDEEEIEPLHIPDSMRIRPYTYEATRYGSSSAARTATERHFSFSSDLAMFIIRQTEQRIDARLTTALHLTIATGRALDIGVGRAEIAFRTASESLSRVLSTRRPSEADMFGVLGFPDPGQLLLQIVPLVSRAMRNEPYCEDQPGLHRVLRVWTDDVRRTLAVLDRSASDPRDDMRLRLVAIDYMHMLNNRLGIGIDQECFAYRLVADSLGELQAGRSGDARGG